jgi:hypothetical protein
MYSFDLIGAHQEKCQYIPHPCPINKLNIGQCNWTGISSSMTSHLEKTHPSMIKKYYGGYQGSVCYGLGEGSVNINGVTRDRGLFTFMSARNAVFLSRSEIKNGVFYSALQYFGPAADAAKYKYKLEFFNEERTESLAITVLAKSWDEDLSDVHNSGKCVKLFPEQFRRFLNEGSELAYSMEVIAVKYILAKRMYLKP